MYPIVKFPEPGTVLYPYRENCRHEVSRLKARFCEWLTQQVAAGVVFRNDIGICLSERMPLICPDMVILAEGHPEVRVAVEIDDIIRRVPTIWRVCCRGSSPTSGGPVLPRRLCRR